MSEDFDNENEDEISEETNVREQDRFLPIANINRIMKKVLPGNAKIARDAKETVQECVSEFISFITSEASEKCYQDKRKTINGEDILYAMKNLGFDQYVECLAVYLQKYRESTCKRAPKKMERQKSNCISGQILISDTPSNSIFSPLFVTNNVKTQFKPIQPGIESMGFLFPNASNRSLSPINLSRAMPSIPLTTFPSLNTTGTNSTIMLIPSTSQQQSEYSASSNQNHMGEIHNNFHIETNELELSRQQNNESQRNEL